MGGTQPVGAGASVVGQGVETSVTKVGQGVVVGTAGAQVEGGA